MRKYKPAEKYKAEFQKDNDIFVKICLGVTFVLCLATWLVK